MSFEQITITGNIGSAEIYTAKSTARYLKLSVACNKGTGTARKTTWYSVMLFGHLATNLDTLLEHFKPGRLVAVSGRPEVTAYLKKDGSAGLDNTIIAQILPKLLDNKPNS